MARYTVIDATYTRPANTTQYAADDALSDSASAPTALAFGGCAAKKGSGGKINKISYIGNSNEATPPQFELYLFSGTVAPTATNDNAEFNLSDAQANNLLGMHAFSSVIDVDVTSGTNGNSYKSVAIDDPFKCSAGVTDLWGLVKMVNTYTPVSGEVWKFRLHIDRG